jgi:hypothetical protein
MKGSLFTYLANDHARLERLLTLAGAVPGQIDMQPYAEFRKGLLRHISIEEKIVIPAITERTGSAHKKLAALLRLDHGALVSLLVPPPSPGIIATIRIILTDHNPREEGEDGLYDIFERVAGSDKSMLRKMESAPDVPVLPHNEKPGALEAVRRAVERAGYVMKSES